MSTMSYLYTEQNFTLILVDEYLKENNITMKQLINMNETERLDLIKQIQNTKRYNSGIFKCNLTHEMLIRFIDEYKLAQKELKLKIENKKILIVGYNKQFKSKNHPSCIDYLILRFYDDNFKLGVTYSVTRSPFVDITNQKYVISGDGKTASITLEENGLVLRPHCISIDSPINIEAGKEFVIKFRLNANSNDQTNIRFAYFMADSIKNVEHALINWNGHWTKSSSNFQALFYKNSRVDYCREYEKLPNGHNVVRRLACNAITPSILSDEIWTIKINLITMNMIVYYNGIKIKNVQLYLSEMIKYILPIFSIITRNKNSIKLIDSYIH